MMGGESRFFAVLGGLPAAVRGSGIIFAICCLVRASKKVCRCRISVLKPWHRLRLIVCLAMIIRNRKSLKSCEKRVLYLLKPMKMAK